MLNGVKNIEILQKLVNYCFILADELYRIPCQILFDKQNFDQKQIPYFFVELKIFGQKQFFCLKLSFSKQNSDLKIVFDQHFVLINIFFYHHFFLTTFFGDGDFCC